MKVRYRECRTIKTGDYENVKIEYEREEEFEDEFEDNAFILKVKSVLDSIENDIRNKQAESKDFQTIVNNWIQEKDSELRYSKIKTLLEFYGVSKLKDLPPSCHDQFISNMFGENDD